MELCLECGVPDLISEDFEWSAGTIVNRKNGREYVFLDCRLLEAIYEVFEFLDGPRAALIITEARRRTVREEALLSLGFLARRLNAWFVRRQALATLRDSAVCCGLGNIRVRSHEPNGKAVLEITDPCFTPLIEAEVRAYWEAVEGFQPAIRREEGPGMMVFHLERPQEEARTGLLRRPVTRPAAERMALPRESGNLCTTCGAPIEISRFNWNLSRGTVYDSLRETHVCMVSVPSMNAAFVDLKKHYGEGTEGLLLRVARAYMRGLARGSLLLRGMGEEDFLKSLSIRGGTGTLKVRGGSERLELEIDNPWSWPVLAGEIAGWLESANEDGRRITWRVDQESASLKMRCS